MKAIWKGLIVLLAAWSSQSLAQAPVSDPSGDWRGVIVAGEIRLRAALHLGATSTFDSPDQGALGLPAQLTVEGPSVVVTIAGLGVFEGILSADGQALEGTLKQGPASIPVRFERGIFAAANRPQTPLQPFPYRAQDVSYGNPRAGDLRLAGTLTLPPGNGPFPAVLLITGSGAQDRDETIFEHKPFLLLADALTRRGVAVLRVDDRGVGGSSPGSPDATTADFATDVEAGLAWLRAREDINPARVGLLGHSEGGLIASIVAGRDPSLGFVVLWAGQGVSGKEIIVEQVGALARANGAAEPAAQAVAELQRAILDSVMTAPDEAALRSSLDVVTAAHGIPPLDQGTVERLWSPWYRHFLAADPGPSLRNVQMPVLALLGGKDMQVTPDQNAPALRAALAGNSRASVEVLPSLNHLFQTAQSGAASEYGTIEETMAPIALARIVDWIVEQTLESGR